MSGQGAPDFTERPTAARAKIVLEPSTTLPRAITSSITLATCTIRSAGALELSLCSSSTLLSWRTISLWPVIRANAGASSFNPETAPMDAPTRSSAALTVPISSHHALPLLRNHLDDAVRCGLVDEQRAFACDARVAQNAGVDITRLDRPALERLIG